MSSRSLIICHLLPRFFTREAFGSHIWMQGFIGTAFGVKSIPTLILVDVKTGAQSHFFNGSTLMTETLIFDPQINRNQMQLLKTLLLTLFPGKFTTDGTSKVALGAGAFPWPL